MTPTEEPRDILRPRTYVARHHGMIVSPIVCTLLAKNTEQLFMLGQLWLVRRKVLLQERRG